jgi:hypothetical protein
MIRSTFSTPFLEQETIRNVQTRLQSKNIDSVDINELEEFPLCLLRLPPLFFLERRRRFVTKYKGGGVFIGASLLRHLR